MKKLFLTFLMTIFILTACEGGTQPAANPTEEPVTTSQTESSPAATELVEVKLEPQAGDTRSYVDGSTIVYVPAGEFSMGVQNGIDNPEHVVSTNGFWIYATEVTKSQYDLCVATGACTPPAAVNTSIPENPLLGVLPITNVTHQQAQAYCQWANGRLPTEAEWEKAARAPEWTMYPWGNEAPSCSLANYGECQKISSDPVTSYPNGQTPYQIFDMAGNAFEWVADWYGTDYYLNSPTENPTGPAEGTVSSVRGGSYLSGVEQIAAYARSSQDPQIPREDLGFRCIVGHEKVNAFAPMCMQLNVITGNVQQPSIECPEANAETSSFCKDGVPYITYANETEPGFHLYTPAFNELDGIDKMEFNKILQGCESVEVKTQDGEAYYWKSICQGPEGASFKVATNTACNLVDVDTSCSEGYEYDPNQQACIFKPKEGDENIHGSTCPTGFAYDPNAMCCTAAQGMILPLACQPGFVYNPNSQSCVDIKNVGNIYTTSDYVIATFPFCTIQDKPDEEPEPEPTQPPICIPNPATGGGCP
ncbi:MAG: SUMF1/EgtB/PvdO family nonheme iron enzyme [Anaerolineales bacterium]